PMKDPVREPGKPVPVEKKAEERTLPSAAGDVLVAGGGRFLILHLQREKTLAVFHPPGGHVGDYPPAPHANPPGAAGRDGPVSCLRERAEFQRWSVKPCEKEATAESPFKEQDVLALCMGSASAGPLLVGVAPVKGGRDRPAAVRFLDPMTFKPLVYDFGEQ